MDEIRIVAGTAAGPLLQDEVDSFVEIMRVDLPEFNLDLSYLRFLERCNGVKPIEKYFSTTEGERHCLDWFLNFADPEVASH